MSSSSGANTPKSERSSTPRIALHQAAQLVERGGMTIDVVVTDISKDGFHLTADVPLPLADHVHLRIARYGDFPVQIRWTREEEAGGVFLGRSPDIA